MDKTTGNIEKIEQEPSRKLTYLYIIALSCIALLSVFGQILVQQAINNQKFDGKIINLAGRQRFQSQSIVKIILILTDSSLNISQTEKELYFSNLERLLNNWSHHHEGLRAGKLKELNYNVKNSVKIDSLFKVIDPHYNRIYKNARHIQDIVSYYKLADVPLLTHNQRDTILANEGLFLDTMDKMVNQYNLEAEKKIDEVKRVEIIVLIITLIVLLLEGFLIFRPSANQIKTSFQQLAMSEYKSRQLLEELSLAYTSLEKVQADLRNSEKEKFETQLNEQKSKATSIVQGQEEERKRISADLHDGLGQLLTLLKLKFEQINIDHLDPKEQLAYKEVGSLIKATIQETRNISFNLMPSVLSDFGILPALKLLCQLSATTSGIDISFESYNLENKRFEKSIEIGLYRIAQEAINNAIKYAQCPKIEVVVENKSDYIFLKIKDSGIGFTRKGRLKNKKNQIAQNGIINMEERAELLNGTLIITSNIGKGTIIEAVIPILS